MRRKTYELWIAFALIVLVTMIYSGGTLLLQHIPPASSLFGHLFGIIGFLLMLMTETLYAIRKRQRRASWGTMSFWLQLHIITGLVGPYMVFLHAAWQFNGLAGLTMLLTLIIVVSGFVGRYIYTAIPRSADGFELESAEVDRQIERLNQALNEAVSTGVPRRMLQQLQRSQQRLKRQRSALANTRRMFAIWHTIHVPIGAALFAAAFIHTLAAIYFVTLAR